MSDDLDSKSDAQLNEAFAVEVAAFRKTSRVSALIGGVECYENGDGVVQPWPRFCTDANAVLEWLKKLQWRAHNWHHDADERSRLEGGYCVSLVNGPCAYAPTFERAAVIALIRDRRFDRSIGLEKGPQ